MPGTIDPQNAIAILGILREGPRSGYDLKTAVEDRAAGLLELSAGSLYYALKCFEKRGWVSSAAEKRGRRPERRLYRLTPDGRKAFVRHLEEAVEQPDRLVSSFDLALFFAPHLTPEALLRAVERREQDFARWEERLHRLEELFPVRWPFHLYYLKEKAKEIAQVNERWCQRLRKKIMEKFRVRA